MWLWVGAVPPAGLAWLWGALSQCGWGFPTPSLVQLHCKTARCTVLSPWGRIRSYSEPHLLHILGFNTEIMNGFPWTCMGWRFVEDESGLSATYTLQLNMQKINLLSSLNCLNSRMYMKLIDLDVLLHEKWAGTMIPILKVVKKKYDTKSSTFKGRLMLGVCSYVFASDTRDLFFTYML